METPDPVFEPAHGLRNPHVQTLLNSSGLRRMLVNRRCQALREAEQEWLVDGGQGVRLVGHYSSQPGERRGVVVLLHGWEGSSQSNYVLSSGATLFAHGFDVFRLNFRDHGDSHHLNPGIFHSCRLDEVINGLGDMQERSGGTPWHLAGFSLGGNFALRVALKGPEQGLRIAACLAVCPVIDPANVLKAMEDGPTFYEKYYIEKWAKSLRKKQRCFPDRYAYDEWFDLDGLRARTEYFATRYYQYETLQEYFDGYSVAGQRLAGLQVPTTILTARDDPVVPVSDVAGLPDNEYLNVLVTEHGGHCGYLQNWKLESWLEPFMLQQFTGQDDWPQMSYQEQRA